LFIVGPKRKEKRKRKEKDVIAKTHSLCSLFIPWQDWHNSKSEDPSWPINFVWKWLDKNKDHSSRSDRNDWYDELHRSFFQWNTLLCCPTAGFLSDFLLTDLRSTTSFSPDYIVFESHKKTPNVVYSTRRLVSVVKREVNCNQGIAQGSKL